MEVACSFTFQEEEVKWDSAYFGQYYDKIKGKGFTIRNERKGIQVNVSANIEDTTKTNASLQESDTQMIFQDPNKGFAITMGNKALSFHVVRNYIDWDQFNSELLIPFYNSYSDLGLYKKVVNCQILYLNQFFLNVNESLSDYFTVVTQPLHDIGIEGTVFIQKSYIDSAKEMGLLFKINSNLISDEKKMVALECGAVSLPSPSNQNIPLIELAAKVHKPIRDFFENIVTDKLREIL